ncbi:hypothetical protein GCM10023093_10540 [Nemorincola caseinilytica]|uniref:Uncharacterized protein n=1 Tax=Nemorincola caseinilytica TaxID=2054315 RepID=A0ABP8N848_9BACT
MISETKKLHLIEEILKIDNEAVLDEVETVISRNAFPMPGKKSFSELAGTLNDVEAREMMKNIEEGCEQIHPDDWK